MEHYKDYNGISHFKMGVSALLLTINKCFSMKYFPTSLRTGFFQKAIFILFILVSNYSFGQKNIYTAPVVTVSNVGINNHVSASNIDPQFSQPNHISINPKGYVKLKIDSELGPFIWTKVSVKMLITPVLSNGQPDNSNQFSKELIAEYNPAGNAANFSDLSICELKNSYGVTIKIQSVSSLNVLSNVASSNVNANVSIDLGFESERYYQLTTQLPSVTANIGYDNLGNQAVLNFIWPNLVGATEYELEWTWVDNYDINGGTLSPDAIKFSSRDFELNNTRIRTPNNNYEIPLIYARGYIIYRVRGIGRFIDNFVDVDKDYYGQWSSGLSNKVEVSSWENSFIAIEEHEALKNWQFKATYSEQGKKKEVVNYLDGSLRNRQTVTKINSEKEEVIVGETIYDAQGRAAVEVMPVPVRNRFIGYFKNFNLNINNQSYSHLDFDWDKDIKSCISPTEPMTSDSGASKYYSKNNDFTYNPFRNYTPDALRYPFSQIEYTPDNTGRIARKGSVGKTFQLDTDHEIKYFYTVPHQEELNRIFGYHVGYVSHYKKNIIVDPNEQVSINYLDPQGRTVATALAGDSPKNLQPLKDATVDLNTMNVDLLGKVNSDDFNTAVDNNELSSSFNFSTHEDKLTLSKQLGVAGTNIPHKFQYDVINKDVFVPEKCPEKYSFVYDLEISLKDKCETNLFNKPESVIKVGQESFGGEGVAYSQVFDPEELLLNTGSYNLIKKLTVNKAALNNYADHYVKMLTTEGSGCYIDPAGFAPDMFNIDCNTTCKECVTAIGTKCEYILKQIKTLYNVPEDNGTIFTSNGDCTITVHNLNENEDETINFGQLISQETVNGQVIQMGSDWEAVNQNCQYLCGNAFASSCGVAESTLANDVSPGGQYGVTSANSEGTTDSPNLSSTVLSVFNEDNQLIFEGNVNNVNPGDDFDWRHPNPVYKDEDGSDSKITVVYTGDGPSGYSPQIVSGTVQNDGEGDYVKPQNLLQVDDFITSWRPSWAKSLIKYHPEYCYLEYTQKLCELTKETDVKQFADDGTITGSNVRPLSTDEYDSYLGFVDTFDKAVNAGLFDPSNPYGNQIYNNDPYFSNAMALESNDLFGYRKNIILEALNEQYETSQLDPDLTPDPSIPANFARLYEVAVMTGRCNAIETCTYNNVSFTDFSTLSTLEKNRIWNTYKGMYMSVKQKIKHVFLNLYAKSQGCYNGCIGTGGTSNITSVIRNYTDYNMVNTYQLITDYINQNNPSTTITHPAFCSISQSSNYSSKVKRFIPIDYGYDSDGDATAALNELMALGNYQYYIQTGNCPMVNDLNLFLTGTFEDINISSTSDLNTWNTLGQGLTANLFRDLTGYAVPAPSSPGLTTAASGATLSFSFTPVDGSYTNGTGQLVLELPSDASLSWNDYSGLQSTSSGWKIIGFTQLYYNNQNSDLSATPPVYSFEVIARVANSDNTNIRDIIITGKTIAKIGGCHLAGEPGNGQVIYPSDDTNCNKKQLFINAFKELYNHLVATEHLTDDSYPLADDPIYASGFLPTLFGTTSTDNVAWEKLNSLQFAITVNGQGRAVLAFPFSYLTLIPYNATLQSLTIGEYYYEPWDLVNPGGNYVEAIFATENGNVAVTGQLTSCFGESCGGAKRPVYFSCCSTCGEWDFNGNGIGDLCDQGGGDCGRVDADKDGVFDNCDNCPNIYNPDQADADQDGVGDKCEDLPTASVIHCPSNSAEEIAYETGLRAVINDFLLPGHHYMGGNGYFQSDPVLSSSNPIVMNFINSAHLLSHFQSLRTNLHNLDPSYNTPVSLKYYKIKQMPYSCDFMICFSGDFNNSTDMGLSIIDINLCNTTLFNEENTHVNSIDVNDDEAIRIDYTINSTTNVVIDPLQILERTQYTYGVYEESGNYVFGLMSAIFCDFITNSSYVYPPQQGGGMNRDQVDNDHGRFVSSSKNQHIVRRGDAPAPNPEVNASCQCVPQTVAPVTCASKYREYLEICHQLGIDHEDNDIVFTEEQFCNLNLQYLIDSYRKYLAAVGISTIMDDENQPHNLNFLTLAQFGDTQLHYGYQQINEVINAYAQYNSEHMDDPDRLYWNDYVNTIYMAGPHGCPPASMPIKPLDVTIKSPCEELMNNVTATYQLDSYNAYIAYLRQEFIRGYIEMAVGKVVENFKMTYKEKEYQYTLYYYDQAGNLIETVAPNGVNILPPDANLAINTHRSNNVLIEDPSLLPDHGFKTDYKYNTLNQLVWQNTPDGGTTRFAYDRLGRIIATQNAKQIIIDKNYLVRYSYSNYDYLGRVIETGEILVKKGIYDISEDGRLLFYGNPVDFFNSFEAKREVTTTIYSEDPLVESGVYASTLFVTNTSSGFNPSFNNRNRVTGLFYHEEYNPDTFDNAIFYNYDVHGNVKEMITYNKYLKGFNCSPGLVINDQTQQLNDCEKHIKRVVYDYDLMSGNVQTVTFQPKKDDQFIHKYSYDADNRIKNVETSQDGVIWENDAKYSYYLHGPIARVEIGDKRVQGTDYAYTLQGWIKGVNGENLTRPENDMGMDGLITGQTKTKDAFGYSLSYYDIDKQDTDYLAIENDNGDESFAPLMFSRNDAIPGNPRNLFNGNMKQITTGLRIVQDDLQTIQKNNYTYDQLNRITELTSSAIKPKLDTYASFANSYSSKIRYDRSGNIRTLDRTAPKINGSIVDMDILRYDYQMGNNKLNLVSDLAGNATTFNNDLENQIYQLQQIGINYNPSLPNSSNDPNDPLNTSNYVYDEIGQLIADRSEGLTINWRIDGKVKSIIKSQNGIDTYINFEYDGLGNRIAKKVADNISRSANTTYYCRDAEGNVLGVYDLNVKVESGGPVANFYLKEHHIYGNNRIGLEEKNKLVYTSKGYRPPRKDASEGVAIDALKQLATINAVDVPNNTDVYSKIAPCTTTGTLPVRDYSFNFGLNKFVNWSDTSATLDNINPDPANLSIDTNIKINNDPSIASGVNYSDLAVLTFKDNSVSSPVNVGAIGSNPLTCYTITQHPDANPYLSTYTIFRPATGCNASSMTSASSVFGLNQSGSVRYTINGDINQYNGASAGFVAGGVFYGVRTAIVGSDLKFYRLNNLGSTLISSIPISNFTASYEPEIVIRKAYLGVEYTIPNSVGNINTVVGAAGTFNNLTATLRIDLNANRKIPNLRVIPESAYVISTKAALSVRKLTTNIYTPKLTVTKYLRTINSPTTEIKAGTCIIAPAVNSPSYQVSNNFSVSVNTNFSGSTIMKINGVDNFIAASWPTLTSIQAEPAIINQIGNFDVVGGSKIDFDLCYFNYGFNNTVSSNYGFDDSTTFLSPVGTSNATLNVVGAVRRMGPCLLDQDKDGLYDIYEVTFNPNNSINNIDTDGDGCPNYRDPDDDGDGIRTNYEGTDLDADHNPFTGILWNHDAASVTNPDNVPDYLDADDDGDGVNTEFEGANPNFNYFPQTFNAPNYSINTDNDGNPNYLDNDDDNDGLYTFYETADPNNDHNPNDALNTDSYPSINPNNSVPDTVPNFLDNDDDGDGILTAYEWPDPNMNGNPNDAVNTDIPVSNPNQYVSYDFVPNYLDVDDDGDGYQSWETVEGGPGLVNANAGTPYVLDSDGNNVPNYLDFNNLNTQSADNTGPFSFKDYLSLIGDKRYEFINHMGNVLVVINDKKIPYKPEYMTTAYFNADILAYNDYYPFGMLVPNRFGSSDDYRYGFNTQEKVNEISGEGNHLTATFWEYDPRTGRRWNLDPEPQISISDYATNYNNPNYYNDPDGDCPNCVAAGIGAVAGGLIGGLIEAGTQYYKHGEIKDWKAVGGAAAQGAITGAAAGFTGGASLVTTAAVSGTANAVGGAVSNKIQGKEITIKSVAVDFITGAAFGAVFKKLCPSAQNALNSSKGSVWKIAAVGPGNRGFVYEQLLKAKGAVKGMFKSDNFPVIDAFYKNVATSVKTLDLQAKSYLNGNAVFNKLKAYVDDLADFKGAFRKNADEFGKDILIENKDIKKRVLELGIPKGATKAQLKQIENIKAYAKTKNITVNVRTVE